ncbi:MAG: tetratricopeptide repeat protein [Phycisphaerales bacterium]
MPSIEQLEKLLTLDEQDTFVLYALGQTYAKAGDHDRAIDCYERCIAVDEAYCYAYYHQARSYEATGRIADAIATLERGLEVATRVIDSKASGEIDTYLGFLRRSAAS